MANRMALMRNRKGDGLESDRRKEPRAWRENAMRRGGVKSADLVRLAIVWATVARLAGIRIVVAV